MLHLVLRPVELEIELFCRGMRIDPSCDVEERRSPVSRTRAGLGSGPGDRAPGAAQADLGQRPGRRALRGAFALPASWTCKATDRRRAERRLVPGRGPAGAGWYSRTDVFRHRDEPRRRPSGHLPRHLRLDPCLFWASKPSRACKFCTTGRTSASPSSRARSRRRGRGRARGAGRVRLDLHAPEHRLPLRGRGPARADPRAAAVRAVRAGDPRAVGGFIGVQACRFPSAYSTSTTP